MPVRWEPWCGTHQPLGLAGQVACVQTRQCRQCPQAFADKLLGIAQPMHLSMTYDQGRELAMHKKLSEQTGIAVYFCDPHSLCNGVGLSLLSAAIALRQKPQAPYA